MMTEQAVGAAEPESGAVSGGERAGSKGAPPISRRQRRAIVVILVLGCLLRLGWVMAVGEPPTAGDPIAYDILGDRLARGEGYRNHAVILENTSLALAGRKLVPVPPTAFYPVGYPAALGGLYAGMRLLGLQYDENTRTFAAMLLNVALGTAMIGFAFGIARRLLEPTAALVAAALVAVEPNLVYHTGTVHLETLATTLLLAAVYVLVRNPWPRKGPSVALCAGAGLLIGVGTLVRPTGLVLVVLLPVVLAVARAGWRRALALGGVVLAGAVVVLAPWTIRNTLVMHAPIVVSTGVADALCMGRHAGADGSFRTSRACDGPIKGLKLSDANYEIKRYQRNSSRALDWVVANPFTEIHQWYNRMLWAHRVDHDALAQVSNELSPVQYSTLSTLGDGFYFVLFAFGVLGARAFARRHEPRALLLLLAAFCLALVPLVLFGDPRYKVPFVPVLAILAAPAMLAAWRGSRRVALRPRP